MITCLTSTCGRPELLEEAIYCFLQQDYDRNNRIMLILNDHPKQKLYCAAEGVEIFNLDKRMESLGTKRDWLKNKALELGADYLCIWDDDDLHMPWKISKAVDFLKTNGDYDIYSPVHALSINDNKEDSLKMEGNYYEAACTITSEYAKNNSYPHDKSIEMDQEFMKNAKIYRPEEDGVWSYIYRWGMFIHHLSGHPKGDTPGNWDEAWDRVKNPELDEFILRPKFNHDYFKMFKNFVNNRNNNIWSSYES